MKKRTAFFFFSLFFIYPLCGQSIDKPVHDAFLISRMAEKFHIQPRPLDDEMSSAIYTRILETLDGEKIFFLQEDINKLSAYRYKIDDEIKNNQSAFCNCSSALTNKDYCKQIQWLTISAKNLLT